MNDSIASGDLYSDWYGSSYPWFFWISFTFGILISISNGIVICLAIKSQKIHSRTANWFVVALAIADFVFGIDKVMFLPFAFTFAEQYPILCALEGCIHFTSGVVATSAPSMMTACRYYTVIDGLQDSSTSSLVQGIFFSKNGVFMLIAGSWIYFFIVTGTLLGFGQMGMSVYGFCGTKPFTSLPLYVFFMVAFMSFVYISTIGTIVYSTKLTRFMKKRNAIFARSDENKETKELLKMIKIAAAQPFVFQFTPVFVFFLADLKLIPLPIAYGRVLAIIFAFAALIDPWLTIFILRPFRKEFVERFVRRIFKQDEISSTIGIQHEATLATGRVRAPSIMLHRSSI